MATKLLKFTPEQEKIVKLTDQEVEKIAQDYFDLYFKNAKGEGKPTAYFAGGPIASGKSFFIGAIRHMFEKENKHTLPYIDRDVMREMHPRLKQVKELLGENWVRGTDDCPKARELVVQKAVDAKYSFISEYTFSSNSVLSSMKLAKESGFRVEAHILALDLMVSKLRQFARYFKEVGICPKNARYETLENQESIYNSQEGIINQMATEKVADILMFYDKDKVPKKVIDYNKPGVGAPYRYFRDIAKEDISDKSIIQLYKLCVNVDKRIRALPNLYAIAKTQPIEEFAEFYSRLEREFESRRFSSVKVMLTKESRKHSRSKISKRIRDAQRIK